MLHSGQSFEMLLVTHTDISFISRYTFCLFLLCCVALLGCISKYTHAHTPAVHHSCSVPSLVGNLGGGLLFQSVYDWLDAPLHAGRYAAGDGVARGRSRGAGLPQTLLIPQLQENKIILVWFYVLVCTQDLWYFSVNMFTIMLPQET